MKMQCKQPKTIVSLPRLKRSLGIVAILALILTAFVAVPRSDAQQSLRIVAVVNDEMISMFDLRTRIALVAAFSGFDNSPETQKRLAPQVLQTLIDERVRLQEAKRLEITAKKHEIDREKSAIESRTKIAPGQLLKSLQENGINPLTLVEQLEAQVVWSKIIRRKFGRTVQISDQEVDEVIDEIKRNKGQPENLVYEIFLPVDSAQKAREVEKLAARLIQQIQSGTNFSAIARNFSQSPSASKGGSLGWNRAGQLGTELDPVVQLLKPGQTSTPIRTADGIYILYLQNQRISTGLEGPPPGPPEVTLRQLHLAAPPQSSQARIEEIKGQSQSLTAGVQGCNAFDAVAKKSGSPLSGELGTFTIDQISTKMRSLIKELPVGQPSHPYFSGDGVIVLMVCGRKIPQAAPVNMEEIRKNTRNSLTSNRLSLSSRRYLRDLRRAAFIDIRF